MDVIDNFDAENFKRGPLESTPTSFVPVVVNEGEAELGFLNSGEADIRFVNTGNIILTV